MSEKNNDKDIPLAKNFISGEILEKFKAEELPIYWGPQQLTTGYSSYTEPNKEGWRHKEWLQIPQVVRFINGAPDEYNEHEFDDDGFTFEDTFTVMGYGITDNNWGIMFLSFITSVGYFCPKMTTDEFNADNDNGHPLTDAFMAQYPIGRQITVNGFGTLQDELCNTP